MRVPILRQGPHLVASIQSSLSDDDWLELRGQLVEQVRHARSQSVVIDVGNVDVLDSFAGRMLQSIAQTLRLRGVKAMVVGIAPDVAYAMAQMGLRLEGVTAALDLDHALEVLGRRAARRDDAR
jgi:rsbT antagonist protein RsbS